MRAVRQVLGSGLLVLLPACGGSGTGGAIPGISTHGDAASQVNLFVGTQSGAADFGTGGGAGNTFPGAVLPFGMLQFSPDTVPTRDNFSGGYTYSDSQIDGFSLTHISGAGCAIFQDVPILPTAVPVTESPVIIGTAATKPMYVAQFSHEHEQAEPGYYRVVLNPGSDHPVEVELTATERSGMARFGFQRTGPANVLVNAGGSAMANHAARIEIDPARNEVTGSATSGRFCYQDNAYTVYFVIQFDRTFSSYGAWDKFSFRPGGTQASDTAVLPLNAQPIPGGPQSIPGDPSGTAQAGGWVGFDPAVSDLVQMRVGISFVSVANARANLNAENPGWDFARLRTAARSRWNRELGRIEVSGEDLRLQRMFYTALYHSLLAPSIFSDVNGDYLGMDGRVRRANGYTAYSSFSGWDIYRTQFPLLAMLDPARSSDMVRSLLANAAESGWLPKWSFANQHSDVMVGDPAALMIAGAHAFGARDFDTASALDALIKGATQPASPAQYLGTGNAGYIQRPALTEYQQLGYIPFEENFPSGASGLIHRGLVWGSSSTSLEYVLADFAIDRFAQSLGMGDRTQVLRTRSGNWRTLLNPDSGYIEPRLAAGLFLPIADPASGLGFTEGSGAQYSWFVPHDVAGLVQSMGGRESARARLDHFFTELNAGPESVHAFLGNEPSLFTPWLYAWLGQPGKTTPIVHAALTSLYDDAPTGMPGNDDLGAMSAWWVLGALGLMPAIPGTDTLLLNAPLFEQATVHLPAGTLRIQRSGLGEHIHSLTLDGVPLDRAWLGFSALSGGDRRLHYTLGTQGSSWASADGHAPPSFPVN